MLTITAGCAFALSACAGSPPVSTGDRITQRGGEIAGYGEDWTKGRNDVAQGQKLVARSAKAIADGEKDLARAREAVLKAEQQIRAAQAARTGAERQIVEGTALMQRAEADYAAVRAGPSAIPPAD
jgi:hypothetical protein